VPHSRLHRRPAVADLLRDYDLIVVGGGPAGATLGGALRAQGWRVLLLDKAEFPRDKTCAGWVTPAVLDALQIRGRVRPRRVLQPIHGFRIGLMGQPACDNHHGDTPVSYGIRRCEFDHYLLQRSGVEQVLGEQVRELVREDGHWIVDGGTARRGWSARAATSARSPRGSARARAATSSP
jgi:menaquinone-9 beta-reductase